MIPVRRRKAAEVTEVDSEGSWAVSYGDMITLLLTFFILFFSIDPNKEKNEAIQQSILATLSKVTHAEAIAATDDSGSSVALRIGKESGHDIDQVVVNEWGGKIYQVGARVVIEFPLVSFFDSAKTDLTRDGEESLKRFARAYMPYAGTQVLVIRAFTDHRPVIQMPGRRYRDNLELSALRSVSTMRVLQRAGIPLGRMRLSGQGEFTFTEEELSRLPADVTAHHAKYSFARKVVLVIEPEISESRKGGQS